MTSDAVNEAVSAEPLDLDRITAALDSGMWDGAWAKAMITTLAKRLDAVGREAARYESIAAANRAHYGEPTDYEEGAYDTVRCLIRDIRAALSGGTA